MRAAWSLSKSMSSCTCLPSPNVRTYLHRTNTGCTRKPAYPQSPWLTESVQRPVVFNAPWLSWLQRPTVRLRNHPQSEGREFEPHWGRYVLICFGFKHGDPVGKYVGFIQPCDTITCYVFISHHYAENNTIESGRSRSVPMIFVQGLGITRKET